MSMLSIAIGGVLFGLGFFSALVWGSCKARVKCNFGYHTWFEYHGKELCSNCLGKKTS